MIGYEQKLARVLDRMGGLYALPDILARVKDGRMQSFVRGNSWLVTEINVYPRNRTLDLILAAGDLGDRAALHDDAVSFAEKCDIPLIRTFCRKGWMGFVDGQGWKLKTTNYIYHREM